MDSDKSLFRHGFLNPKENINVENGKCLLRKISNISKMVTKTNKTKIYLHTWEKLMGRDILHTVVIEIPNS